MLDFGKKSRFITTDARSLYGILEVLRFYELIGINYIYIDLIVPSNQSNTPSSLITNRKLSCSISKLESTINENSFRVDLIIIQNYRNFSIDTSFTEIPVILLENPQGDDKVKFDFNYVFSVDDSIGNIMYMGKKIWTSVTPSVGTINNKPITDNLSRYLVEDMDNNWKTSLEDLKVKYIRNKKLDDLFGLN